MHTKRKSTKLFRILKYHALLLHLTFESAIKKAGTNLSRSGFVRLFCGLLHNLRAVEGGRIAPVGVSVQL